jgi:hypothetical protein
MDIAYEADLRNSGSHSDWKQPWEIEAAKIAMGMGGDQD